MKINSCSVKFYLELTKVRHDGHAIFCRIIIDRKKAEFKLPFNCCLIDWDDVSAQPKSKSPDALIKIGEIARIQSIINNALNDVDYTIGFGSGMRGLCIAMISESRI